MRISGIYAITNKANHKLYVGSSVNVRARWNQHRFRLVAGTHTNPKLQFAWAKYGADAFEFSILEVVEDADLLVVREQYWIDRLRSATNGYNAKPEARNLLGFRHSDESKARMSQKRAGRKHSEETRKKIGQSQIGRQVSESTRKKISEAAKGRRPSDETRRKQSESHIGRRNTPDSIEKSSQARRGRPLSEAHRENIRLARLAYMERIKRENPGALKQSREHVAKREAARLATLAAKKAARDQEVIARLQ